MFCLHLAPLINSLHSDLLSRACFSSNLNRCLLCLLNSHMVLSCIFSTCNIIICGIAALISDYVVNPLRLKHSTAKYFAFIHMIQLIFLLWNLICSTHNEKKASQFTDITSASLNLIRSFIIVSLFTFQSTKSSVFGLYIQQHITATEKK